MKKNILIFLFVCVGLNSAFSQTNDTVIKVDSDGNVGINEQNPDKQLVVNGDVEINGNANISTLTVGNVNNSHVPSGAVIMWYGDPIQVPAGWILCDGRAYTNAAGQNVNAPDLRGRFIAGYNANDNDYSTIGNKGGEKQVVLTEEQMPAHAHSGTSGDAGNHSHSGTTSTNGNHNHNYTHGRQQDDTDDGSNKGMENYESAQTEDAGNHSHTLAINSAGQHNHAITANGGGQAHENRPPFYVLAFIIKQ